MSANLPFLSSFSFNSLDAALVKSVALQINGAA